MSTAYDLSHNTSQVWWDWIWQEYDWDSYIAIMFASGRKRPMKLSTQTYYRLSGISMQSSVSRNLSRELCTICFAIENVRNLYLLPIFFLLYSHTSAP